MIIQKRNGQYQDYDNNKIKKALEKAFKSLDQSIKENDLELIIKDIEQSIYNQINVEMIQDYVEESLMKHGYLQVAKAYILYRQKHSERRRVMNELLDLLKDKNIEHILLAIQHDYPQEEYSLQLLLVKFKSFYKENMNFQDTLTILAKASNELISRD